MEIKILEIHPDDIYFSQKDEIVGKIMEVLQINNCYKNGDILVTNYKGVYGKIDNQIYNFYGIKFEVIPEELKKE